MRTSSCTAFEGGRQIGTGTFAEIAILVKKVMERGQRDRILIFDDFTGEQLDFDLRGAETEIAARLAQPADCPAPEVAPRRPGRPSLGVVAKEVTLLPRHWDWLGSQPGGASVALRKLVEEARKANAGRDRIRQGQEATYRFISAMAGNLPGFEEANRALFAGNGTKFVELTAEWPIDVRDHARRLAGPVFAQAE